MLTNNGDGENSPSPDLFKVCYLKALNLLARRDYSKSGLAKKLSRYPYPSDVIFEVLEELIQQNFLNEQRFLKSLMRHLVKKGKAKFFIVAAVQREKILFDVQIYEEILQEEEGTYKNRLQQLIEKAARKHLSKSKTLYIFQGKVSDTLYRQGLLDGYESVAILKNMLRDIWLKNKGEGSNTMPDDII